MTAVEHEKQDVSWTKREGKGVLTKERVIKPDGRYLLFYRFRRPEDSPEQPAELSEERERRV